MLCGGITLFVACIYLLATAVTVQASVKFTLDPVSGVMADNPGETIGWGFTISNDTVFYFISAASPEYWRRS